MRLLRVGAVGIVAHHAMTAEERAVEGDAVFHDVEPACLVLVVEWQDC